MREGEDRSSTGRAGVGAPTEVLPARPPWSRRIGFRLFLALSGLSMAAYFGFPYVHGLGLRIMGLPEVDRAILRVDPVPSPPGSELELAASDLRPRGDVMFILEALLAGSTPDEGGRPMPAPGAMRGVDRALALRGQGFLLVDTDLVLLAASEALEGTELVVGSPVPYTPMDLGGPELLEPGRVGIGRQWTPAYLDGEHVGWLVLVPHPTPRWSTDGTGPVYLPPETYEETLAWGARALNVASLMFMAALALGLSWALSRVVTRRVTDLSRLAATPIDESTGLPGPFDTSGEDEIASLARSMNAMRTRVAELVEDLKESDRTRRSWIAQVSHDLRTPLTALIAALDGMSVDVEQGRLEDIPARLEDARLDARRLGELTEDLLEAARLDLDPDLVREPVPPGELVRQAVREVRPLSDLAKLEVRVDLSSGLPELEADGRRLMRALENLLRNAITHASSMVTVQARPAGEAVRFTVEDDGPGLPLREGEDVWESLASNLSRPDSAGLGLVVVRRVAELHGGCAGAGNRPEGGASLWFQVPTPA